MVDTQISDQQLAFMRALWKLEEAAVGDVQSALSSVGMELAPTTVATVLGRLEKKGLVDHRREGRAYVYRALVTEDEIQSSILGKVRDHLFRGDVTALVSQLLDASSVSDEELSQVRRLLDQKRKDNRR